MNDLVADIDALLRSEVSDAQLLFLVMESREPELKAEGELPSKVSLRAECCRSFPFVDRF